MVTKVQDNRRSNENNGFGDNRMKDEWTRAGGMNMPRMRAPEDQPPNAGLMMEVWASVASWFLKPDITLPLPSGLNNSSPAVTGKANNCRISEPVSFAPTICTAIRCTVPGCSCECFTPGKLHMRYCESCSHGWVPHALDKLGFRHIFAQTPVEPVQSNVAFDIASLVLYGCQALPIRLKILLDRLFSVLQKDEVTQILRGFGWTPEDYARGYILQETHGAVLDRWNICSPEEEPLVLQQFLRFGETRAITQQLLLHGLGDLRNLPRVEADFKRMVEKGLAKNFTSAKQEERKSHKTRPVSPTYPSLFPPIRFPPPPVQLPALPPPTQTTNQTNSSRKSPPNPPPPSLPFVKLPQTGLTCTPITNGPVAATAATSNTSIPSPISVSPLNKLQNMQPFDFRKIASGAFTSTKSSPERRRQTDEASHASNVCLPSPLLPPPMPVVTSASISKSPPSYDFKGSSDFGYDFGSEDGDDEEENSQGVLNLSKSTLLKVPKRHSHARKASTPMKRQWGSSNLPLNLGTQLINPATGKKRVQCNVCLKTFCDKGALKIHFSAVHLREMHKCTVEGCNMMFSSRRSRNRHSANPNPKLHSPHLRRKISPHDGRSAQSHPILIPPLQGGLNPLSFGPFPLLAPPDLRQMQGLDLKHGMDFGHVHMEDSKSFDMSIESNYDYMMDEDDEEGIVVDGGEDEDSESNSAEKAESSKSKRIKMSESDMDDGVSNTDSNDSIALSDLQTKEEAERETAKNVHKRKSKHPTRCTFRVIPPEDVSEDERSEAQNREWDLSKKEEERAEEQCLNLSKPKGERGEESPVVKEEDGDVKMEEDEEEEAGKSVVSAGHSEDDEEGVYISDEDVPLDKDNPRRCTACGKMFQNHFGVKAHFQNVHLKLMHKCVVDGCNAAFPSKRSRDRHSSNSNLHRKLLSTSDSFRSESPRQVDFLARLYGNNNNNDNEGSEQSLMLPPPQLTPPIFPVFPTNGSESLRLVYNVEEDAPVADSDGCFRCRFCAKNAGTETAALKNHYERRHLHEMPRCKVPGCWQVFSSRTKRNVHSDNKLLHFKDGTNS